MAFVLLQCKRTALSQSSFQTFDRDISTHDHDTNIITSQIYFEPPIVLP